MVTRQPPEFEYFEPTTLEEAVSILGEHENAKVLAGGTDLIISMRDGKIAPTHVVNIKRIPGLDAIGADEGGLRIGALTTIGVIDNSALVRNAFPMVAEAAHALGCLQVRNRATLGGNLCNSSPSADMAPPLIVLGATAKIVGPRGERKVPLEDFFTGPGKTVLAEDEILTELWVPNSAVNSHGAFVKQGPRTAMDIAVVNAAGVFVMKGKICTDARMVLGAVAPIPLRIKKSEAAIRGREVDEKNVRKVAETAAEECRPISDVRGSEDYRRQIVNVLVRRLFAEALHSQLPSLRGAGP